MTIFYTWLVLATVIPIIGNLAISTRGKADIRNAFAAILLLILLFPGAVLVIAFGDRREKSKPKNPA